MVGVVCKKHGLVDPVDVYVYPNGHRKCRICGREYMARMRGAEKAKAARRIPGGGWWCQCGARAIGRGSMCAACMTEKRNPVPKRRLRPLVEAELARMGGDVDALAARCGVDGSTIRDIVREDPRRAGMQFEFGDRILTGLGLMYLWHVPAEQGGFGDVYAVVCRNDKAASPAEAREAA